MPVQAFCSQMQSAVFIPVFNKYGVLHVRGAVFIITPLLVHTAKFQPQTERYIGYVT